MGDGAGKPGDKDGAGKPAVPKRKPSNRKIAEKGIDCDAIPKTDELSKESCVAKKLPLLACARKAGVVDKIKKCAELRDLKTRKVKKKLVKFAQKVKGIDFSKNDEATNKKKSKYEKAVLKLFKAVSGIFTYNKDDSRLRRKLAEDVSYSVQADLETNSDDDADAAAEVDAAAVSDELKADEDFTGVTIEAPAVEVEEVEVEEVEEVDESDNQGGEGDNDGGEGDNDGGEGDNDGGEGEGPQVAGGVANALATATILCACMHF